MEEQRDLLPRDLVLISVDPFATARATTKDGSLRPLLLRLPERMPCAHSAARSHARRALRAPATSISSAPTPPVRSLSPEACSDQGGQVPGGVIGLFCCWCWTPPASVDDISRQHQHQSTPSSPDI